MDREKLKMRLRQLELAVDAMKAEIYSDVDSYKYENYNNMTPLPTDYDEVFEDNDSFPS